MEKKPKITPTEKREHYSAGKFSVREGEDKGKVIEGVAIVTEQETVLWEGSDYREIEVIAQSCIAPDFIAKQDMAINLLHNRDESFARTPNSLRVESREDGLHFEADVPDCDLGKRAQALTENGTYQGCSFEFYPKDYEVSERKAADGKTAYPTTSVGVRELYREQHPDTTDDDEKHLRELEEQAEQARFMSRLRQMKREIETIIN